MKFLIHMDAYRLENAEEAIDLDLDRMLEEGALLVEWAERIKEALSLPMHYGYICVGWRMNSVLCCSPRTATAARY